MKKHLYRLFALGLIISFSLLAYSLYEPHTLEITRYTIKTPELAGIKIVFAADFHLAPAQKKRLNKIISAINAEHPDVILLGGDYVKGHKHKSTMPISQITDGLAKLYAPYGTYAVLGNHDNWYGKTKIINAFTRQNISILDNKNIHLNIKDKELTLVGVSDLATDKPDFIKAFQGATAPAILITHSPDTFPQSPQTALTLAAHTHGGQINLPYFGAPIVPSKFGQRYTKGLIQENGKTMIITKGLGTSILPLRLNCQPEIVVISFQ